MSKSNPTVSTLDVLKREPLVLVGIVTHNRATILPKAIRSALSQGYPNIEVAVFDDGSDDGTAALQSEFPMVQWERWDSSKGYLQARNHLMQTARAEFYLSLDDDAWFLQDDEISVAIRYMEDNPRVGAVAFDILSPDRPSPTPRSAPRPTSMFIGCGHLVRISALRDCGFYTPSPGTYGSEEKDLCLRLLNQHWDTHVMPGVHVWHDKTALARDQAAQHRSGVCNDLVFALRRCPLPLMLAVLPAKVMSHLQFAVRRHLVRPYVEGLVLFLRHIFSVWRSRSPVRSEIFVEFLQRSREA